MALPNNRIKQIKLPDNNTYDIVPSTLTDGTTSYALTAPTLTSDSTIALTNTNNNFSTSQTISGAVKSTDGNGFITTSTLGETTYRGEFKNDTSYILIRTRQDDTVSLMSGNVDIRIPTISTSASNVSINFPTNSGTVLVAPTPSSNKDKYLHTNASTGDLEWASVTSGPTTYLKSASSSGNTLTLTKEDDTTVTFTPSFTDTKNTAGSTNDTSKLFLVGAKTQATYDTTYSRNNTFINANGVLVNTTGFSSYSYATSSGSGLLNVGSNGVNYYSGSGPASFKATSSTHGSWQISDNNGNIYLQKTSGSASSGTAYLLFPKVGTSSSPKTLATTDDVVKVTSAEFIQPIVVNLVSNETGLSSKQYITIYDGRDPGDDPTSTIIYEQTGTTAMTSPLELEINSGHIFIIAETSSLISTGVISYSGGISNVSHDYYHGNSNQGYISADVSANGTLQISVDYDD